MKLNSTFLIIVSAVIVLCAVFLFVGRPLLGRAVQSASDAQLFGGYGTFPYGITPYDMSDCGDSCKPCTEICAAKPGAKKSSCQKSGYSYCTDGRCVSNQNQCSKNCADRFGPGAISCPAGSNSDGSNAGQCCSASDKCFDKTTVSDAGGNAICCTPPNTAVVIKPLIGKNVMFCDLPSNTCEAKNSGYTTCGPVCCTPDQKCVSVKTVPGPVVSKCVDADNACQSGETECGATKDTTGNIVRLCCKANEACSEYSNVDVTTKFCSVQITSCSAGQEYCAGSPKSQYKDITMCCPPNMKCSPMPDGRPACI